MNQALQVLLATIAAFGAPDIVPEHSKAIAVETRLDLGPFAARAFVAYEVKKGDTLAAIAKAWLGDAARADTIAAANPGLEPLRLRIGTVLWLPPQDVAAVDPVHVFVQAPHSGIAAPFVAGASLPPTRYGNYQIYLVGAAHLDAFVAEAGKRNVDLAKFAQERSIVMVDARTVGRYVASDSPIARTKVTLRLVQDAAGKLQASSRIAHFDKAGAPLDEKGSLAPPAPGPKGQLLLLALAGGALLWVRRRHEAVPPALA